MADVSDLEERTDEEIVESMARLWAEVLRRGGDEPPLWVVPGRGASITLLRDAIARWAADSQPWHDALLLGGAQWTMLTAGPPRSGVYSTGPGAVGSDVIGTLLAAVRVVQGGGRLVLSDLGVAVVPDYEGQWLERHGDEIEDAYDRAWFRDRADDETVAWEDVKAELGL
jgi:hypothetical protein